MEFLSHDMDLTEMLSRQLRGALRVTHAHRVVFGPGIAAQDDIVTTNRLILVLKGRLQYRLEDAVFRFEEGTQFFVPAWTRRVSRVPSRGNCEAIWCEFEMEDERPGANLLHHRKMKAEEVRIEKGRYEAIIALRREKRSTLRSLQIEAELKAMLGRFWAGASAPRRKEARPQGAEANLHPEVKKALRWLGEHFRRRDALKRLYLEAEVSPNYLRGKFQAAMACHPGAYLQRLRLSEARYLLRKTSAPQKQIAAAVGYDDALYFSRVYRRFWGHAPGGERQER